MAETKPKLIDGYFWLTLALAIFAVAPLAYPGYFQTHSGLLPLWHIDVLRQNLLNPAWTPAFAQFNPWGGEGLLPYYIAALLPLPPLTALKLTLAGSLLAAVTGLFLWLKSWIGPAGASVSALAYLYAPFIIATLYVRGAFSETVFWGLLPWALLAATFLVAQPRPLIFVIGTAFWVALGLTHWGLALWAWFIVVAMQLLFHRPQSLPPISASLLGVVIAAGLNVLKGANVWPATNFFDHFLYPAQLLIPQWGFGISSVGWEDGMSFSVGFALFALAILTFSVWRGQGDRRPWLFFGIAIINALLTLSFSAGLWRLTGLHQLLATPWQLLGFSVLTLAVFGGVSFWLDDQLRRLPIFAAVVLLVLLAAYPNLAPQFTTEIPAEPVGIYGQQGAHIFLLNHQLLIENPQTGDDLNPVEPYLPFPAQRPIKPGETIYLETTWQAMAKPAENYKVFVHLVDGNGQLLAQVDTEPLAGERPTETWLPGEWLVDRYALTVPDQLPQQPVQLWVGFYSGETLQRLPATGDDQGRVILAVR